MHHINIDVWCDVVVLLLEVDSSAISSSLEVFYSSYTATIFQDSDLVKMTHHVVLHNVRKLCTMRFVVSVLRQEPASDAFSCESDQASHAAVPRSEDGKPNICSPLHVYYCVSKYQAETSPDVDAKRCKVACLCGGF